jgi:hypothetical protein
MTVRTNAQEELIVILPHQRLTAGHRQNNGTKEFDYRGVIIELVWRIHLPTGAKRTSGIASLRKFEVHEPRHASGQTPKIIYKPPCGGL